RLFPRGRVTGAPLDLLRVGRDGGQRQQSTGENGSSDPERITHRSSSHSRSDLPSVMGEGSMISFPGRRLPFGPRMRLVVPFLQTLGGHMGVNLRRGQTAMSQ